MSAVQEGGAGASRLWFEEAEHTEAGKPRWTAGIPTVLSIWFLTRLMVWLAAYLGAAFEFRIVHQLTPRMEHHQQRVAQALADPQSAESQTRRRVLHDFEPLCRSDGFHYRSIVEGGYRYRKAAANAPQWEKEQNIAFFPLFPMLARVTRGAVGSANAAMILVSHVCSLLAALVLYRWVWRRIDASAAAFAVALVFCLPQACYFSFAYAESVTLLLSVLALSLADGGSFAAAGLAVALATASRPTALALAPTVALAHWVRRGGAVRAVPATVALLALGAAGAAAYAGFLQWRFGSALVYFENFRAGWVQTEHRADWPAFLTLAPVFEQFKHFRNALLSPDFPISLISLLDPFAWNMVTNIGVVVLSLVAMRFAPASFRALLALGPLIFLQAYLASGGANFGVQPISRYVVLAIGVWVALAAWAVRRAPIGLRHGFLAACLVLQFAWALRFGLGEWSS
ncbi:MAG: mannosyltransferase family protein [Phycisphaerae bacterium]|nr:mannosyltransferase family protein [Phycisphaerae bacterium]